MWYDEAIDATAVYVIDTTAVVDIMEDVAEPIVCVGGAMEQAHKCFSLGKKRRGSDTIPNFPFPVQLVNVLFRLHELYQLFLGCCFTSWRRF